MNNDKTPKEVEMPILPEGVSNTVTHFVFPADEDPKAYKDLRPLSFTLYPNKKDICKKNGAHRLCKTIEQARQKIAKADLFMENTNKIVMATGVGLAAMGTPLIGFCIAGAGLCSEILNEMVVGHAHGEMDRAVKNIATCQTDETPLEDKVKAVKSLVKTSRSMDLWEGATKAIGTIGLYAVGELYALIDFSNTMKEAKESYEGKPKKGLHLAHSFKGALREFLHGLDLPKEKPNDTPKPQ